MIVLRHIVAIIKGIFLIILMMLFLSFYAISLLVSKNTPERAFRLRRNYIRIAFLVFNIKLQKEGKMYDGPALYVCNHRSFIDPVLVCRYVDAYVIAKAEVASMPVLNTGAKFTGIIYVKRENRNSRHAAREMMSQTIQRGYNVLVYPEGTIATEPGTIPFRPGSFAEMARLGLPVVPIALEYQNDYSYWRTPSLFKHFVNHVGRWDIPCKMKIGQPIWDKDGDALRIKAESWVNIQLKEMQSGWSNVF